MKGSRIRNKVKHLGGSLVHLGATSPPPIGPELPVELWLLIAEYLEPKEKRKLIGVNRLFYELAMDELYGHLSLVSDDPWLFIDTMETLRCVLPRLSLTQCLQENAWPETRTSAIESAPSPCGQSPFGKP
jgi:hypothetical protein